jgi:CRISPR-associated protein (TIGR03986 family)
VPTDVVFPVSEATVINYIRNLHEYLQNEEYGSEYKHLYHEEDLKAYDGCCVFYSQYKQKAQSQIYLSPSMISREVFYSHLSSLHPSFKPCDNRNDLCAACDLFGMISDNGSAASKLRFSDAVLAEGCEPVWDDPCFLDELAGPKASATEFYVRKPGNADNWTYDYAYRWKRDGGRVLPEIDNDSVNLANTRIRGRKFYWHSPDGSYKIAKLDQLNQQEQESKLKRLCKVHPLKEGSFKFRVYFNRVKESDLYKMIWVLTIGMSDAHGHKIGMGKPIGLGSVGIKVLSRVKRAIDPDLSSKLTKVDYEASPANRQMISGMTPANLGCEPITKTHFEAITKLKHDNFNIAYPYILKQGKPLPENYKWFMANKQISGTPNSPVIYSCLPDPSNPELPVYEEIDQQR